MATQGTVTQLMSQIRRVRSAATVSWMYGRALRLVVMSSALAVLLVGCAEAANRTASTLDDEVAEIRDELAEQFRLGIAGDATCAELFSYRDSYADETDSYFDTRLQEVGCLDSASTRTDDPTPLPPATRNFSPATTTASSSRSDGPIDQMVLAFVGGYSRQQIKSRIDRVMTMYGLSYTSDNYSRAGSVLVGMRKEFGPSEMDILSCMIASYVDNVSFPEMAAISTAFLSVTGEC